MDSTASPAERFAYRDYPPPGAGPPSPDALAENARADADAGEHADAAVALCLSGGGLRAALFHVGAVRRLAETGALARVDLVSAVSGGSVFAAHLLERIGPWPTGPLDSAAYERNVAAPFRALAASDLRRPLLGGLLRGRHFVETMVATYAERLSDRPLAELPDRPRFVFNATDLGFGVNWVFERRRVGSYRAGYLTPRPDDAKWTVARAVAASSCFPPAFRPMQLSFAPGDLRGAKHKGPRYAELVARVRLSDGGVYDNLGLQPALSAGARTILASDGGAPLRRSVLTHPATELLRYSAVLEGQVSALRRGALLGAFREGEREGAYWSVESATTSFTRCGGPKPVVPGYSKRLAQDVIARVRTDLDAFNPAEAAVLENHGYALAEAALRCHASYLLDTDAVPFRVPHPAYSGEQTAEDALAESSAFRLWRRNL